MSTTPVECLLVKDIGNSSFWNSPPGPPTVSRDPIMKNFMGARQWDDKRVRTMRQGCRQAGDRSWQDAVTLVRDYQPARHRK